VIIKKIQSEGGSQLRSSPFWDITHRRLEGSYRRFGTTSRPPISLSSSLRPSQAILDCLTLEEGTDRFLRNVSNYKSALCNIPEERRSHLNSGGSLKSQEDLNCIQRHDDRSFKLLWRIRTRIRDKRSGVRVPLETRDFPLLQNAQTDCGVHSASYSVDAGVRFQG